MGQMMGKMDPNATNTVDQQGNVVATGTQGGRVVADPNQGLSGGQMFARRAMSGSLQGLANGLQNQQRPIYQQRPSPGMKPMQTPNDFPYPGAQQPKTFPQGGAVSGAKPFTPPDDFPYPGTKPSRLPMDPNDQSAIPVPPPDSIYGVGVNGNNNPLARGPNPFTLFYGR